MSSVDFIKKKQGFNLTEIFTSIKSKTSWSDDETKTFLLFLESFSKNTQFIKPNFSGKIKSNNPNNKVRIPMERFNKITSFGGKSKKNKNYYKDFRTLRTNLTSKSISLPHPLDTSSRSSIERALFITAEYNAKENTFDLTLHNDLVERFEYYSRYITFDISTIEKTSNDYTIRTYIYIKGLLDIYRLNEIELPLNDFKDILILKNKYKQVSAFRTYVLKVVEDEINKGENFDIKITAELKKVGRSYSRVKFTFHYKKEQNIIEHPKLEIERDSIKEKDGFFGFNTSIENSDEYDDVSEFESVLFEYGVRAKRISEIEMDYPADIIQKAIEETEKAYSQNKIQTTRAKYFMGALGNMGIQHQEKENLKSIKEENQNDTKAMLVKQKEKEEKENLYRQVQRLIFNKEEEFKKVLSANSMGIDDIALLKLTDDFINQINMLKLLDLQKIAGYKKHLPFFLDEGFYSYEVDKYINPNMDYIIEKLTTVISTN